MTSRATRRAAAAVDRERRVLERIGERAMVAVAAEFRAAVLAAFRSEGKLRPQVLARASDGGVAVLWMGMAAAALTGRQRSATLAGRLLRKRRLARSPVSSWRFSAISGSWSYQKAIDYLAQRQTLSPAQVESITSRFGNEAARVMRGATAAVETSAQQAIAEITREGMHVREGMAHLGKRLDAAGVGVKPHLLETLARTQINLAHAAGQELANADPAIQEILWGYEYSAVGDDRTRPSHAALDGTRLPKGDPMWMEIAPPNGFQCRCKRIEIFNDDKKRARKKPPRRGGKPDKGWAFNPASVMTGAATPIPQI